MSLNIIFFQQAIENYYPYVTVSIGWVASYDPTGRCDPYNQTMVEAATEFAKDLRFPVTFAVHAKKAEDSWGLFQKALAMSRGFTITLWADDSDVIDIANLTYIRRNSEKSKIFYEMKDSLRGELE